MNNHDPILKALLSEIESRFDPQPLNAQDPSHINHIRNAFKTTARLIILATEPGNPASHRSRALALTKLQEASFWTTRSIAESAPSRTPQPTKEKP